MKKILLILIVMCFCASAYALTPTPTITRTISPTITPTSTATPHPIVDVNHVIMTTKMQTDFTSTASTFTGNVPACVTTMINAGTIDGYSFVYIFSSNSERTSTAFQLKLLVPIANIATVKSTLVSNAIDSGAVTQTAYNGISQ